jgi:hypothetical protein
MFKFFNAANNNTNSNKEDGNMTRKERWMANIHKGQDLGCKAAHKTGYGLGYATTTVKEEVAYAARKVADTVSATRVAEEFTDGYYDGKADAYNAFADRVGKREAKARAKADAKAAEAAAEELMDEFEDFDDALCGDGEWN